MTWHPPLRRGCFRMSPAEAGQLLANSEVKSLRAPGYGAGTAKSHFDHGLAIAGLPSVLQEPNGSAPGYGHKPRRRCLRAHRAADRRKRPRPSRSTWSWHHCCYSAIACACPTARIHFVDPGRDRKTHLRKAALTGVQVEREP